MMRINNNFRKLLFALVDEEKYQKEYLNYIFMRLWILKEYF